MPAAVSFLLNDKAQISRVSGNGPGFVHEPLFLWEELNTYWRLEHNSMYRTGVNRLRVVYGQGAKRHNKERKRREKGNEQAAIRLLICLALFLLMYIGKGIYPKQMAQNGQKLLDVIRSNVDLEAAMHTLGQSISGDEDLVDGVMDFCAQVFAPTPSKKMEQEGEQQPVTHIVPLPLVEMGSDVQETIPQVTDDLETDTLQVGLPALEVGQVIQTVETSGTALPDGYEEDVLYLGDIETATPVSGRITSEFGYRDHPTIGRYSIHNGVDIGAYTGDPIVSFSDGQVREVGENRDFGNYLYIEHLNGVTSFYAHCSSILVKEGQQVTAGERVALVGQTGQATGPHLHFELLYNGIYLDPIHYIEAE